MMSTITYLVVLQSTGSVPIADNPAGIFDDMGHMMMYGVLIALTCAAGAAWLMIKVQKRRDGAAQMTSINPSRQDKVL
jgi:hypothetical protein